MSNDLFHPTWEKPATRRVYYLATASTGAVAVRGSWRDMYSHACIRSNKDYENQIAWSSFHSTKELAEQACKRNNKWYKDRHTFEVVELTQITASEARKIRRLAVKADNEYFKKLLLEKQKESDELLEQQGYKIVDVVELDNITLVRRSK